MSRRPCSKLRDLFKRRLILTGTPIANRPQDIWSQIFFLDGGEALGRSYDDFKSEINLSNSLRDNKERRRVFETALGRVSGAISRFAIRETKESAKLDIPEKTIEKKLVELEHRQREIYQDYCEELASVVVRDGAPQMDDADVVLKRLLRLIQIASNPILVDESYVNEPGKLQALRDIVGQAIDRGEKVIVWTTFIRNAEYLRREFGVHGAVVVHGNISLEDRNAALESFRVDPEVKVLVATQGAAKEGLTLTVANNAIFYDRSLSLDDYLQAQDRIHRISQEKPCTITNLVAAGTIDEWVDSLLDAKRSAARYAQGDIDKIAFQAEVSYDYSAILREVLDAGRRARRH